ncbi:MAG: hypothetical protein RL726_1153, partial [Actinomycetota bacterium]
MEAQQDVGRVTLVPAVVAKPLRSVAVTLIDTAVVEPGMSEVVPTHEPFPESLRVMEREDAANPPVEVPVNVMVAFTLFSGDSSDTGTWSERLAHELPLNRTAMAPTCGGRAIAPTSCIVV